MASNRRTLAAAVATVLASVSLYPLFIGALWFWAGVGAVAAVAVAGTLTRRRRLPVAVCLAGGVLGLLLYLNLVFSGARSWGHLVPTFSSLRALWHLAAQGFDQAGKYAPPVPQLHGMLLLAAAGIGITALLVDLVAVRLERAALAGLPLLLLFAEPFTVNVSRSAVGTTVAFCAGVAGYLALLSSEGRDRIREWEQPNPEPDEIPDTRALAAAGRRVGIASVVVALCVPLFIPGLHATRLFGTGHPGIGGIAGPGGLGFPDPNTQLSKELHESKNTTVLVYRSSDPTPQYLQVYVLDNLTSSGWKLFSQPESLVPASPLLPQPPGQTDSSWATSVTTSIAISKAVSQDALLALPVPYPARTVSAPGTLRADRFSLMVLDSGVQLAGLRYTVTSLDQSPPAQVLNHAAPPPKDITDHYTDVPSSYGQLASVARAIAGAAGAKTPFQEAVALQDWLSSREFKYTLNAPSVTDAAGLTTFLENTRRGYCQQFSFAMAVLARLLGIPSRVAYGYTAGTFTNGGWLVSTHDAHAWPELYFQGFGWLRFEPTPQGAAGQGTATAPAYTLQPSNAFAHNPVQTGPSAAPTSPANSNIGRLVGPDDRLGLPVGSAAGSGNHGGTLSPWEIFGLALLGLLVLAAAAPGCARLVIRRRRWRSARRGGGPGGRQRSDAALAHAAWRELRDDLVDYGSGYLPSESPRALAARAGTSLGLAEPARAVLGRIALAEERARYAARPVSGAGLREDSATIRRAIAAAVPRWTRWRARLMPSSVITPALAAISQVTDIFGRLNPEWFGRARLDRARHGLGRGGTRPGGIRAGHPDRVSPANAGTTDDDPASRQEPPVTAGSQRQ